MCDGHRERCLPLIAALKVYQSCFEPLGGTDPMPSSHDPVTSSETRQEVHVALRHPQELERSVLMAARRRQRPDHGRLRTDGPKAVVPGSDGVRPRRAPPTPRWSTSPTRTDLRVLTSRDGPRCIECNQRPPPRQNRAVYCTPCNSHADRCAKCKEPSLHWADPVDGCARCKPAQLGRFELRSGWFEGPQVTDLCPPGSRVDDHQVDSPR